MKDLSEKEQLESLKLSEDAIAFIKNPSELVKFEAVKLFGKAILYIKNPSEALQIEAVKENGEAIEFIQFPSEAVQLEALKQNRDAIRFIHNPSQEVLLELLKQNDNFADQIENISQTVKLSEEHSLKFYEFDDENLPKQVKDVINYHSYDENDYVNCEALVKDLNAIGWNCDYGLDGVPFDLHMIDPTLLNQHFEVVGEHIDLSPVQIDLVMDLVNALNNLRISKDEYALDYLDSRRDTAIEMNMWVDDLNFKAYLFEKLESKLGLSIEESEKLIGILNSLDIYNQYDKPVEQRINRDNLGLEGKTSSMVEILSNGYTKLQEGRFDGLSDAEKKAAKINDFMIETNLLKESGVFDIIKNGVDKYIKTTKDSEPTPYIDNNELLLEIKKGLEVVTSKYNLNVKDVDSIAEHILEMTYFFSEYNSVELKKIDPNKQYDIKIVDNRMLLLEVEEPKDSKTIKKNKLMGDLSELRFVDGAIVANFMHNFSIAQKLVTGLQKQQKEIVILDLPNNKPEKLTFSEILDKLKNQKDEFQIQLNLFKNYFKKFSVNGVNQDHYQIRQNAFKLESLSMNSLPDKIGNLQYSKSKLLSSSSQNPYKLPNGEKLWIETNSGQSVIMKESFKNGKLNVAAIKEKDVFNFANAEIKQGVKRSV